MAVLSVRGVADAALVAWKKAALDAGVTLREWVIERLSEALIPEFKHQATTPSGFPVTTPIRVEIKQETRTDAEILAEGQRKIEEKRKMVQEAVPGMRPLTEVITEEDRRSIEAFFEKYGRNPKSPSEFDVFKKRGW